MSKVVISKVFVSIVVVSIYCELGIATHLTKKIRPTLRKKLISKLLFLTIIVKYYFCNFVNPKSSFQSGKCHLIEHFQSV